MNPTPTLERLRFNMIEQQIRPWDVLDLDILDLLARIRREDYVPEAHRALAFFDMEIPLEGASTAATARRWAARRRCCTPRRCGCVRS